MGLFVNLGCCMGFEPMLTASQTVVLTATLTAPLVLLTRIELVSHPYQGCVLPFNYRSMVHLPGTAPGPDALQASASTKLA